MQVRVRNKRRQQCTKCEIVKPLSEFWKDSSRKNGRISACKDCEKARLKRTHVDNPEIFRKRVKKWKEKNRDRYLESSRNYQRKRTIRLKREVIVGYGGKCACCGESKQEFLCIDHIDGKIPKEDFYTDGTRLGGVHLYYRLKRNGFPKGYQILCWNCNGAIGAYGYCPHKRRRKR